MIRFKIYFFNRSFINVFKKIIFYQIWENDKFDFNYFKIVDNVKYKIISRIFLKISNDKFEKCILLKYDNTNQYRIFNLIKQKIKLTKKVRFHEQNYKSNLKIRSNINVNHESSITTTNINKIFDQKIFFNQNINHNENFSNKKTRSQNFYNKTLFVECQRHLELKIFDSNQNVEICDLNQHNVCDLFEKIQITIVKFQNQNKNLAIFISILFVNVEIYQNITKKIFNHFFDFDSQKFINYKKIIFFFQQFHWYIFMKNKLKSHKKKIFEYSFSFLMSNEFWMINEFTN